MFFLGNNGRSLALSFFLILFFISASNAQNFNGPGFSIIDGSGRNPSSCSIVPVTGLTSNVVLRSVSLNSFSHGWVGDLEARIYPPSAPTAPSTTGSFVLMSPPDNAGCNTLGTYRFIDTATSIIDTATVGCTTNQTIPAGDYRTSDYGGGTNPGSATSLSANFGSLTPAQANGNWSVCVFDFLAPDGGGMAGTTLNFTVLTAAQASVNGRVLSLEGRGLSGITVILTDSSGNARTAVSNSFGIYNFDEVTVGETYTVTAAHKRYQFQNPTQILNISENVSGLNFIAASE